LGLQTKDVFAQVRPGSIANELVLVTIENVGDTLVEVVDGLGVRVKAIVAVL